MMAERIEDQEKTAAKGNLPSRRKRMALFVVTALTITVVAFALTPLGKAFGAWVAGLFDDSSPVQDINSVEIFPDYSGSYYDSRLMRRSVKLGGFNQKLRMGDFTFDLGDMILSKGEVSGQNDLCALTLRFTHHGSDDGFGRLTPDYDLELLVSAEKDNESVFDMVFRFALRDGLEVPQLNSVRNYYAAYYKFDGNGELVTLSGEKPPWEVSSAEMIFTCGRTLHENVGYLHRNEELAEDYLRVNDPEREIPVYDPGNPLDVGAFSGLSVTDMILAICPDRFVIRYAVLRTQTAGEVRTFYDMDTGVTANDFSVDQLVSSITDEDGNGTHFIVVTQPGVEYYRLIDPGCFTKSEYDELTGDPGGEDFRRKEMRIFGPLDYDNEMR